jgi:hypothetical protein
MPTRPDVSIDTPLVDAARLITAHDLPSIPVVDDGPTRSARSRMPGCPRAPSGDRSGSRSGPRPSCNRRASAVAVRRSAPAKRGIRSRATTHGRRARDRRERLPETCRRASPRGWTCGTNARRGSRSATRAGSCLSRGSASRSMSSPTTCVAGFTRTGIASAEPRESSPRVQPPEAPERAKAVSG